MQGTNRYARRYLENLSFSFFADEQLTLAKFVIGELRGERRNTRWRCTPTVGLVQFRRATRESATTDLRIRVPHEHDTAETDKVLTQWAREPKTRLDLCRIRPAALLIAPVLRNTPQYGCSRLGEVLGCELIVKLETNGKPESRRSSIRLASRSRLAYMFSNKKSQHLESQNLIPLALISSSPACIC